MSFRKGLLAARSHLAFLLGLILASLVIWRVRAATPLAPPLPGGGIADFAPLLKTAALPALRKRRTLSDEERAWARAAWAYFERNYQRQSGFVNSVDGYPSTTLWDLGSYMLGLLAAGDLGVIDEATLKERLDRLLSGLARLPLVDGLLPNKVYHTATLKMVDYRNRDAPAGVGWSAIDIARVSVPLTIITWRFPEFTGRARAILGGWRLQEAVSGGQLQGAMRLPDRRLQRVQEGRFGYEQYAAKSLFLLGCDVSRALRYDQNVEIVKVEKQSIASDTRLPQSHGGTHNAVLSEPYILEGIEFGLDATTLPLARAIFRAQENRAKSTGRLVAVSEDNLDRSPYFAYNSILNDRRPWVAFTPDGRDAAPHKTISLKAAFGWSYLFSGTYADRLREAVRGLAAPGRGFYSGRYDVDGAPNRALTANTNGIVLEVLWFQERGPLLAAARQ